MKKHKIAILCLLVCAQLLLGAAFAPALALTEEAWPGNGEIYRQPYSQNDEVTLSFNVAQIGSGYATYIKIYKDGALISGLFIGGPGSASTDLAAGTYVIKTGVGKTWYGAEDAFGKSGSYDTLLFDGDVSKVTLEAGYAYQITINTSQDVPTEDEVKSKGISWGSF